jgi:peptide/nickel transport system permease protein
MILRLLERTAVLLVSLAVSSVLVFAFMAVLPGDPARVALGVNASDEAVAELRSQFGLDRSLPTQYFDWLGGLLHGDLGTSYVSKVAIGPQVYDRLQVTLWLVVAGTVIALAIAVPAGTIMAARQAKVSGLALSALSQVGVAVPAFLAGILLIMLFAVKLGWLPASGYVSPFEDLKANLASMIMPAFVLGNAFAAVLMRHTRSAMLQVLSADYVRTARAKGLEELKHALRNALVPVITLGALGFGELLGGTVLTETVFSIPGFGKLIVDAVFNRDYSVVQGVVLFTATVYITLNLLADLAYFLVNPRMRG